MMKGLNLGIITILILLFCCFLCMGCIDDGHTGIFFIKYNSKLHLTTRRFSVGIIKYDHISQSRYQLSLEYSEEFEEQLLKHKAFIDKENIKDNYTNKNLFSDEAFLFCNKDAYFAVGQEEDGYYKIVEVLGYITYTDTYNDISYKKEFAVPPFLNNIEHHLQAVKSEDFLIMTGESVAIPYDWDYLENFYTRLEHSQIDREHQRISINCYTLMTSGERMYGKGSIDTVDLFFIKEEANQIKFVTKL